MHVVIDGVIFELQRRGGISRIAQTILPLMCEIDPQLHISLYQARTPLSTPPTHPRIHPKRLFPLDHRLFKWILPLPQTDRRNLAIPLSAWGERHAVWHSTYFTTPVHWSGPNVLTVHDLIYFLYPDFLSGRQNDIVRRHMREAMQRADVILSVSKTTAKDMVEHLEIAPHKIRVVYSAASSTFRPLPTEFVANTAAPDGIMPTSKPYLLYIGPRYHYKNYQTLFDAYAKWRGHREIDLVLVGSPLTDDEKSEVNAHGLNQQVHVCSGVSDEALNVLYNGALAFVYPSLYEGFGIPLLEAMRAGCPIIASDIPSSREIAQDYPIYFPATEVDALVHALDTAWERGRNPQQTTLGEQIGAGFSWQKTARQTLHAYYDVSGLPLPDDLAS